MSHADAMIEGFRRQIISILATAHSLTKPPLDAGVSFAEATAYMAELKELGRREADEIAARINGNRPKGKCGGYDFGVDECRLCFVAAIRRAVEIVESAE